MSEHASISSVTQLGTRHKITKERYLDCYGAMRRNILMQKRGYSDQDIEDHWQACLNTFGPELLWLCWRHWFALQTALYTGVGCWHGWRNSRRLFLWKQSYVSWLDVIFPLPF